MGVLKHGREEPPQVRGQGQKPGGPHAQRVVAKSSYPPSEVRGSGSGWEYQTAMAQEWPRGATPHLRSGGEARGHTQPPRSGQRREELPASEVSGSGREEIPHSPSLRLRAAGRRNYPMPPRPRPTSKKPWLHRCRRA